MQLPEAPSVLVLLVATDGEAWLPEVLRGLRAQQHAPLRVLAVDNASTDATSRILRKAFGAQRVVTLEERVGYGRALAAALRVAAERDMEADAFLVLHDDAALAPGSVEGLVEALRIDGVGVVGAKLLEWDDGRTLQDIGRTTDRYGRVVARVERGEIDQGQHDGIHEVLYATSAVMLIGREVVDRIGLFDLRYELLREDLDLCWRARMAGFRTVVTTSAAARHAAATVREQRAGPARRRIRYYGDRNMIATLIKNYSLPRLALALPVTVVISLVNVVLYAARGHRASAVQVLEALRWNLAHLPSSLRARRRAQGARTVGDRQVTSMMHHGATRVRAQIERAVESVMGEVEEVTDEDLERPPRRLTDRLRAHPGGIAVFIVAVIAIVGARPLLVSGPVAGIDMPPFPSGASGLFQEYASGWRGPTAGGAGPATPGFVLLGLLTLLSFGSGWIAQRILLFGLPVLGAIGMIRLTRGLGLGPMGRRIAAVTYGASPLMLGAFGAGRLPDLVLAGAAPFLMLPLLRGAGLLPPVGWRSPAAGVLGLAAVASVSPWALVFVAGVGLVVAAARAERSAGADVLRATALMVGGAAILLLPWSLELVRPGSPLGAGGTDPSPSMLGLLTLSPFAANVVPVAFGMGIAVAASAGALFAGPAHRGMIIPLGTVGLVGLGVAWAVGRGLPWVAPRPSLPLIALAVSLPPLAAAAAETAARELGPRQFGATHILAGGVGLLLIAQLVATAGWVVVGDRPGLVSSGTLGLASLSQEAGEQGDFRVLWIGGTDDAPTVALTGPAGATMRGFLARRAGRGYEVTRRVAASMMQHSTDAAGRLLATLGVRYVVVRSEADGAVREAVASQPDLAFVQRLRPPGESEEDPLEGDPFRTGTLIYRNEAGIPIAAPIRSAGWASASAAPIERVLTAEPRPQVGTGLRERLPGTYEGQVQGEDRAVLLAEDHSGAWRARIGAEEVAPERSFGWATRFVAGVDGPVVVWFGGQRWHRAGVLLQVLLLAAFLAWRSQRAALERGEA